MLFFVFLNQWKEKAKVKQLIVAIVIAAAIILGIKFIQTEDVAGEFKWAFEPNQDIYCIVDGGEPVDAYDELRYNDDVGYIIFPIMARRGYWRLNKEIRADN